MPGELCTCREEGDSRPRPRLLWEAGLRRGHCYGLSLLVDKWRLFVTPLLLVDGVVIDCRMVTTASQAIRFLLACTVLRHFGVSLDKGNHVCRVEASNVKSETAPAWLSQLGVFHWLAFFRTKKNRHQRFAWYGRNFPHHIY